MKLCVLIPSLNQPEYLESAVRSVVDQARDWPETQVCLMDGGSGADVQAIIKRLESEYPDLEAHSAPDNGQADALARGFANTDADILGWLNSDDILLPGAIQVVMEIFSRFSDIDVLYGDALFIDKVGTCIGAYPTGPFQPELLKSFCYLSQPSVYFKKTAYLRAGGIDTALKYAIDYDLWLRLLTSGASFRYLPELLSATRLHSQSKTAKGHSEFTNEALECQDRHFPNAGTAGRMLWSTYRSLISAAPQMPRPVSLALAWILRLVHLRQAPASTVWIYRVIKLHLLARKRARPILGKSLY